MQTFDYARATSTTDALEHTTAQARFIGGGTNFVDLLKHGIETPGRLVDVSRLSTDHIQVDDEGTLEIGAGVTNTDLASDPRVRKSWPVLSLALLSGATQQLRNKATTGGNFLQRTRCYYFYDTQRACNKREPGSGCPAIDGHNRIHAILGATPDCIATHPSDMAVAMVALDAELVCVRPDGSRRTLPAEELYVQAPGRPDRDHVLHQDELIEAVRIPRCAPGRHVYEKARDRASYAFALVSVAAVLHIEDARVAGVRVAFGGVAHKPWRARRLEAALAGKPADRAHFRAAVDAELAAARSYGDNDFKIPLAARLGVAALEQAAGGKR